MKSVEHHKDCHHTNKHHKQSGRCRGNCPCTYALRKVERKERANA